MPNTIVWFRRDLRLADNPALCAALAEAGGAVHQPWKVDGGLPQGYPDRIVDHGAERQVALERYADIR